MASAAVFVMELEDSEYDRINQNGQITHINVGSGVDITIRELAETVRDIVKYQGKIIWDASKPDGTLQKLLDVSLIHSLGWKSEISLAEGIRQTYQAYRKRQHDKET